MGWGLRVGREREVWVSSYEVAAVSLPIETARGDPGLTLQPGGLPWTLV